MCSSPSFDTHLLSSGLKKENITTPDQCMAALPHKTGTELGEGQYHLR
jgi:hypothetical protein